MIKVSVIIPIYNAEEYLKQCLDSLCMQTLREIEIICVDDGSTDASLRIMQEYARKDSRIMILQQSNQYAGVARNTGMKYATGKYFSFLDADDFFEKNFLKKMYIAAEKNGSDIVICRVNYFNDKTGVITARNVEEELIYLPENNKTFNRIDIPRYLFQITNGWAWDKLFKADFIRKLGIQFQAYRIANDGFFVYAALAQAGKITKIDDFLVNQRINNIKSLSNTRENTWYCGFEMIYAIKEYLQGQGLYKILQQTFFNFCIKYVIWSMESMKSWIVKKNIYEAVRDELFLKIQMEDLPKEYFHKEIWYDKYQYIITHTLDEYIAELLEEKQKKIDDLNKKLTIMTQKAKRKVWMLPYAQLEKGSTIVLYGAGEVGQDYYRQICDSEYCKVVLWMDKRFAEDITDNRICGWTDELKKCSYDKVLIAVRGEKNIQEIIRFLGEQNVLLEKIVYLL